MMNSQEDVRARAEPNTGLQGPCPLKLKDRGLSAVPWATG